MNKLRFILRIRPAELGLLTKRLMRVRRRVHSVGDLRFWLDPVSDFGDRVMEAGEYEPEVTLAVRRLLKPGATFLDIGANEGWFSVVGGKQVGKGGRVLAIEPQERMVPVILRNAFLNELPQVSVSPVALGAAPGNTTIHLNPSLNTGASSLVNGRRNMFWPRQQVMVSTVDRLCSIYDIDVVDLAKIDVEGFELEVLRGAATALREKRIRAIIVETHAKQLRGMNTCEKNVEDFLVECGYRLSSVGKQPVWMVEGAELVSSD